MGAPKSLNNLTSTFFNTVNFLPKDLKLECGAPNLLLYPGAPNFVTPLGPRKQQSVDWLIYNYREIAHARCTLLQAANVKPHRFYHPQNHP